MASFPYSYDVAPEDESNNTSLEKRASSQNPFKETNAKRSLPSYSPAQAAFTPYRYADTPTSPTDMMTPATMAFSPYPYTNTPTSPAGNMTPATMAFSPFPYADTLTSRAGNLAMGYNPYPFNDYKTTSSAGSYSKYSPVKKALTPFTFYTDSTTKLSSARSNNSTPDMAYNTYPSQDTFPKPSSAGSNNSTPDIGFSPYPFQDSSPKYSPAGSYQSPCPSPNVYEPDATNNAGNLVPTKDSDLMIFPKYKNTLPDLPFDLKFLKVLLPIRNVYDYRYNSLERKQVFDVNYDLMEHGSGVDLVLHDANKFEDYGEVEVHPADEAFIPDDDPAATARSKKHAVKVPWMRKPEYISSDRVRHELAIPPATSTEVTLLQPMSLRNREVLMLSELAHKDRNRNSLAFNKDVRVASIAQTFASLIDSIAMHKKNAHPVSTSQTLPMQVDRRYTSSSLKQVCFVTEPMHYNSPKLPEDDRYAMIRYVNSAKGKDFAACYMPTPRTTKQLIADKKNDSRYSTEKEYKFELTREFSLGIKPNDSVMLLIDDNSRHYYSPLNERTVLSRRFKNAYEIEDTKMILQYVPEKLQKRRRKAK